jgi:hypothetical protein
MPHPRLHLWHLAAILPITAVLAREPRPWDGPVEIAATYAIAVFLPSVAFGLRGLRAMGVIVASACVVLTQLGPHFPQNRASVVGCVVFALIGRCARDERDLASALLAVAIGVGAGLLIEYDPCTQVGMIVGPLVGWGVRWATRPSDTGSGSDPIRDVPEDQRVGV